MATRGAEKSRRWADRLAPLDRSLILATLVFGGALSIWYLLDTDGYGGLARSVVLGVSGLVLGAGPWARRVWPRRLWIGIPFAGLLMFASVFDEHIEWRAGAFEYSDLVFLSTYGLIICWLMVLGRIADGQGGRSVRLDTAAAYTGAVLAVWTGLLAPLSATEDLGSGILWVAYPPLDVVMLALAVHLAIRLRRLPPALGWFIAGVSVWLITDTAYAVVELRGSEAWDIPVFEVGYLFAHICLAVALAHPRVGEIAAAVHHGHRPARASRDAVLILFAAVPAVLAVAVPPVGLGDRVMRTTLMTILLALLFMRLCQTMTALTAAESDSRYRAGHDVLTGLTNRAAMQEAIDRLLRATASGDAGIVLAFLDCDDFKRINGTWGYQAGDSLLQDLASRLVEAAGPGAVVARQGGDEFVVACQIADEASAARRIARLAGVFDAPMRILPARTHQASGSIGAAVVRSGELCSTDELLRRADAAMCLAKRRGKGSSVFFGPELDEEMHLRAEIGDRLGDAIARESFTIVLQPVMGGPGYGTLLGWEALARWLDPDLGQISPELFISVAEDLGLVDALGESVLRRVCAHLSALRRADPDCPLAAAVNVSPSQLRGTQFVDLVRSVLAEEGLPGGVLHLEVTETVFVDPESTAVDVLADVRALGVQICVDDFGTGYASLATLMRLPVDCVKIDRSLVTRIATDDAARQQLAAVLALVRSLGIDDIVVEGIETPEQAAVVAELGCPSVQGWLYGQPAALHSPERAMLKPAPLVAAPRTH